MVQDKVILSMVAYMVQVFRVEKNRWPSDVAELLEFSEQWDKPLDFSEFHTLVFKEEDNWNMALEYALLRKGNELALCGRLELQRVGQTDMEMTFGWQTRHLALPPKKVESTVYCSI